MQINEWKNVSSEVKNASNVIYERILEDVWKQPKQKSSDIAQIFVSNQFEFDFSPYFGKDYGVTITYTMYLVPDKKTWMILCDIINSKMNNEADYENHRLNLCGAMVGKKPTSDFYACIMHEVNHLFEYNKGREKRVDLYDNVIEHTKANSKEQNAMYYVSYALYYTFPHEVDAFVHEFYGWLIQNRKPIEFEDALKHSHYEMFEKLYHYIREYQNHPDIMNAINYYGYKRKDYMKKLKFAKKRLLHKLRNAYIRYCSETWNYEISDWKVRQSGNQEMERLEECIKYGEEINWGREPFFVF